MDIREYANQLISERTSNRKLSAKERKRIYQQAWKEAKEKCR